MTAKEKSHVASLAQPNQANIAEEAARLINQDRYQPVSIQARAGLSRAKE